MVKPALSLWLGAALLATGCGGGPKERSNKLSNDVLSPQIPTILGAGYDTHSETFKQPCIAYSNDQLRYSGQQTSALDFSQKQSYFDLKDKLDVQVSGRLKLPSYGVKGAAHFLSSAKKTDKSISLVFGNSIQGKSVFIENPGLSSDGKAMAATRDMKQVRTRCGDRYVVGMDLGAALWINVRIDFMNAEAKSEFEGKINFDMVNLFSVSGQAEVISNQLNESGTISISALQIGGDVTELATILNSQADSKSIPFLRCSLSKDGLEACTQALEKIVKYAGEDFPRQIDSWNWQTSADPNGDSTSNGGPAVIKYRLMDYRYGETRSLWPKPSPIIDKEIADARRFLLARYDDLLEDRIKLESFAYMNVDALEKQHAFEQMDIVERNKDRIVNAAIICYDRPGENDCLQAKANALAEQENYDLAFVERPYRFRQYCASQHVSPSAKKTVARIAESLGLSLEDGCQRIASSLEHTFQLDLSKPEGKEPLTDLRPLEGLSKLRRITLDGNRISHLGEIKSLTGLTYLRIRHSNLGTLSGISSMQNLKTLDAAYNRLYDASEVMDLKNLKTLNLVENPIEDLSELKTLDLDKPYLSTDYLCSMLRKDAFARKYISRQEYDFYRSVGFGPQYFDVHDATKPPENWVNCIVVVSRY